MRIDKFTVKAQEAIQDGQSLARRSNQSTYEPEHLLKVMLDQKDGVITPMLQKIGIDARLLGGRVDEALAKLPKMEGAATSLGNRLVALLDRAEDEAKSLKDEFTSSEHVLIAFTHDKGTTGELLKAAGLNRDRVLQAIKSLRGSSRVTSQDPEGTYRALEKYGKDLTELARSGKLDPVIGRDEEIRRAIQVLSRRTKNNPVLIGEPGVGKTAIAEGLAAASSTETCLKV
jgi:ATP-dependent Clp protease ATP-binding subunit ClpB